MSGRNLFHFGFAAALLCAYGCGGGSDTAPLPPGIACSDAGTVPPNTVALTCGAATDTQTERVDVILAGPLSGTVTLRGLNFDVTYDPFDLEYVPATIPSSPLFSPNAFVVIDFLNNQPGHLVVSIQRYGGFSDVVIGPGDNPVLSLTFRRAAGATFGPTPLTMINADATGASTAIAFVNGLSLSYQ